MHNFTKRILSAMTLFLLVSFTTTIQAQKTLTLDECISIALENNIDIKRALNQATVTNLNAKQRKYDFLPSVNGSAFYTSTNGLIFDQSVGRLITATTNQAGPQVTADLTLFDGFRNRNNLKISRLDMEAAEYDVQASKDNVRASVISFYLQVILDRENQKISTQRIDLLNKQLERAQKRVDYGLENNQQVFNLKSQIANENLTKVNLENQYKSDLLLLLQTLLLDPSQEYDVEDIAVPSAFSSDELDSYRSIYDNAKAYSPSIKSAETNLSSTQQRMKLAKAAKLPNLSLRNSYGSTYSSQNFDEANTRIQFFEQMGDNKYNRLSLSLNVPIFNRFRSNTDIQIARINIVNSELTTRQAEIDLSNQLQRAYLDLVSAQSTFKAAKENLIALDQAFVFMEKSYNSGNTDLYSYLEALNNKNRAEIDLANSKFSIVLRKKILDVYQGQGVN